MEKGNVIDENNIMVNVIGYFNVDELE